MVKRSISSLASLIALIMGGAALPLTAICVEVPLKQAVIQSLQNTVELSLPDGVPYPARMQDTLLPGEALSTARAAQAELRFDDGSLARVGGQALVRFVSTTRTLQLSNGTLLLLVPPDRGQTQIQTPNAVASVRGSALFVRYVPETNITLIGALTSGIEIANGDRSQTQMLRAGQLAVVTNNRLEPAYRFDLKTFYETSALAQGLELQPLLAGQRSNPTDGAIEAVRAETAAAVQQQASLCPGNGVDLEGTQTGMATPRQPTPITASSCRAMGTTPVAPNAGQADASLAQPTAIDPSMTTLLGAPLTAQPATLPPTLALPTTIPLVNPPTAIAPPPTLPTILEVPSPAERPLPNPNLPNPNPNLPDPNGNPGP